MTDETTMGRTPFAAAALDGTGWVEAVREAPVFTYYGRVKEVVGLTIEADGPGVEVGQICHLLGGRDRQPIPAEVVGFRGSRVVLMPLGDTEGVGPGTRVVATGRRLQVEVDDDLLGRVLDGLGRPIDDGPPVTGRVRSVHADPPNPLDRQRIREPLSVGVKVLDGTLTCGRGQRMGIFAGSGVGKSTLLGMIARGTEADVNVIALIGERGREVREFLEKDLGDEGLSRSVVVTATSDEPALVRIKAAYAATTVAEYFRDQGKDVLLIMDSVTRFATAQREVGLAVGEPPATRGYPPSVFAVLPKLLERTGCAETGTITGFYSVLVDGDDFSEPVTDTVRSILDGHIVLSRDLASENHYPAVDVLESVSRVMDDVADPHQIEAAGRLKDLLATYEDAEDLINIGAYEPGSDAKIDEAMEYEPVIRRFLCQGRTEHVPLETTRSRLIELFGSDVEVAADAS